MAKRVVHRNGFVEFRDTEEDIKIRQIESKLDTILSNQDEILNKLNKLFDNYCRKE